MHIKCASALSLFHNYQNTVSLDEVSSAGERNTLSLNLLYLQMVTTRRSEHVKVWSVWMTGQISVQTHLFIYLQIGNDRCSFVSVVHYYAATQSFQCSRFGFCLHEYGAALITPIPRLQLQ